MVLNYIWIGFFLIAFVVACVRFFFLGELAAFTEIIDSTFSNAKLGFEIALFLTGVMALWLGIMKIGEKGGMVQTLGRVIGPFFNKLFPSIPKDHPVFGSMLMNFSANMLGLDNAATPLGLKAMHELQDLNQTPDTASNAQIMFLVLNTSGLTIIPISVLAIRAQQGAASPSEVFIPILIATFFATLAGLLAVAWYQKINLLQPTVLLYLGGLTVTIIGLMVGYRALPEETASVLSSGLANFLLLSIIVSFIIAALRKKVSVYDTFIEGAKEGFQVAIKIVPYLVAMLVGIGVFRACGALGFITDGLSWLVNLTGADSEWVKALPTALMKPLSGSGARGMMVETMTTYGADSFAGYLASVMQGSTETTFYVLAVYFGAVNISRTRHAVTCGLFADLVGIVTAILVSYLFFSG
ncbi:MAG: nucleoside recognition domain-containing protein [Bacteroidota bacterium]